MNMSRPIRTLSALRIPGRCFGTVSSVILVLLFITAGFLPEKVFASHHASVLRPNAVVHFHRTADFENFLTEPQKAVSTDVCLHAGEDLSSSTGHEILTCSHDNAPVKIAPGMSALAVLRPSEMTVPDPGKAFFSRREALFRSFFSCVPALPPNSVRV